MLCAVFSLCYVQCLVCVLCSLWSVLCAVFSMCYVHFLVCVMCSLQSRASSLRSEHASLRSVGRARQGSAHDQFLSSKQNRNCHIYIHILDIYIYINIYIYIYICAGILSTTRAALAASPRH